MKYVTPNSGTQMIVGTPHDLPNTNSCSGEG